MTYWLRPGSLRGVLREVEEELEIDLIRRFTADFVDRSSLASRIHIDNEAQLNRLRVNVVEHMIDEDMW